MLHQRSDLAPVVSAGGGKELTMHTAGLIRFRITAQSAPDGAIGLVLL